MPTRGKWGNAVKGMQIAYGVTNTKSYVDAWTGEFIPYGYTQDGFREALKWTNTFYKEGFIDPEFATGSDNQWTEFYANGKAYIEYQYVERALWAETNMKAAVPGCKVGVHRLQCQRGSFQGLSVSSVRIPSSHMDMRSRIRSLTRAWQECWIGVITSAQTKAQPSCAWVLRA